MFDKLLKAVRGAISATRVGPPRTAGPPRSSNGASSFHLWWDLPDIPLREVSVTVEVTTPPSVPKLYFFALQVSFLRRVEDFGGAHLGLQWNPRHPENRAVNWGGYDEAGAVLRGTRSDLPSAPNDPNTRDFMWQPASAYRLRIGPASPSQTGQIAWPGSITELTTGETTTIRELLTGGDVLRAPVIWSEVFADCDDPTTVVRWSDLAAVSTDGMELRPKSCRTAYQTHRNGGCANTSTSATGDAFEQRTNTVRATPPDSLLSLT